MKSAIKLSLTLLKRYVAVNSDVMMMSPLCFSGYIMRERLT